MSRRTDVRSRRLLLGSSTRARFLGALWRCLLLVCLPLLCGFGADTASESAYSASLARSVSAEKDGDLEGGRRGRRKRAPWGAPGASSSKPYLTILTTTRSRFVLGGSTSCRSAIQMPNA